MTPDQALEPCHGSPLLPTEAAAENVPPFSLEFDKILWSGGTYESERRNSLCRPLSSSVVSSVLTSVQFCTMPLKTLQLLAMSAAWESCSTILPLKSAASGV
jgi:hypothetical protein